MLTDATAVTSVRKASNLFSQYSLGLEVCSPVYLDTLTTLHLHTSDWVYTKDLRQSLRSSLTLRLTIDDF
ncbi:hypothetical protein PAECIP111891_01269 [Paenibacillus allorhizoplanae]|uniref:Uncharacterized protein n=1 Tax=Paenibacillus allorhizoplanae TaxID=2905648 RepID=A0ABM9C0G1_9BACL|nr:hypothetical protein PAECIP111891_01269 [Paenibacillus allorhizoplanae]